MAFSATQSTFFSLALITFVGALLFAFTPVAKLPLGIWVTLAIMSSLLGWMLLRRRARNLKAPFDQDFTTVLTIGFFIGVATLLHSLTLRFDALGPQWLPDDFPFFAALSSDLSQGSPGAAFFNGMDINYHWLTYSLFGGIGHSSGIDQIEILIEFAPPLGWLLLFLGAASIIQAMTHKRVPLVLGIPSVAFANSVGLYAYSTSGLGRSVASPSTLLTATWLVGIILTTYFLLRISKLNLLWFPFFMLAGFGLSLGKISTAVATLLGIGVVVVFESVSTPVLSRDSLATLTKNALVTALPFSFGMIIASQIYLSGAGTEIGFEQALNFSNFTNIYLSLIALLPVLASVFSFAVMVLPTLSSWDMIKTNSLVCTSAILSIFGLLVVFVFDFRDGNESWVITASLALIVPVSSVILWEWVSAIPLRNKRLLVILLLLSVAVSFGSSYLLLTLASSDILELRPWLVPSFLIIVSVIVSFFWLLSTSTRLHFSYFYFLVVSSISFLFVTSVTFGIVLRIDAAITELRGGDAPSLLRDQWIETTSDFASKIQPDIQGQPVAIYSVSPGEITLTRWIPYFLNTSVYSLGTDDELVEYFTPRGEADRRGKLVSAYVEDADQKACAQLLLDGINFIWITQGIHGNSMETPYLMTVKCQVS